jgi:hypothetical protein
MVSIFKAHNREKRESAFSFTRRIQLFEPVALLNYKYYVKCTYLYIKYWLVSGGLKAVNRVVSPDPLVGEGGFTHATPDN